jgi:hypothetical protein
VKVWSFTLKEAVETFPMPKGARVLTAGTLFGKITIWAEVNPEVDKERRLFGAWVTGREIPDTVKSYIGTVLIKNVAWHVYELEH